MKGHASREKTAVEGPISNIHRRETQTSCRTLCRQCRFEGVLPQRQLSKEVRTGFSEQVASRAGFQTRGIRRKGFGSANCRSSNSDLQLRSSIKRSTLVTQRLANKTSGFQKLNDDIAMQTSAHFQCTSSVTSDSNRHCHGRCARALSVTFPCETRL